MWWDRIFGATSGGAGEGGPRDADSAGDEGIVVEPADDTSTGPGKDPTAEANEQDPSDEDATAPNDEDAAASEGDAPTGARAEETDGGTDEPSVDATETADDDADGGLAVGTDAGGASDRWAGEDPISFSDEPEAGALLDAVNVDGAVSASSDAEPDSPEAAEPEADDVADDPTDETPSGRGQGDASGAGSKPDPTPGESASDRPTDVADGEPAGDGSVRDESVGDEPAGDEPVRDDAEVASVDDGPVAGADDRVEAAASDAARLRSRLDAVEEGHERISETVGELESEVAAVHDRIDGVHEDVERLVGLVKETAPTRGGSAASTASPDTHLSPTAPVATERDATDRRTADRDDVGAGEPEHQSTEAADQVAEDDGREYGDDEHGYGDDGHGHGDDGQETGADTQPATDDGQTDASAPGDPSPRTDGSSAVPSADADPRSDAAAERLRAYQDRFDGGEPASAVGSAAVADDPGSATSSDDPGTATSADDDPDTATDDGTERAGAVAVQTSDVEGEDETDDETDVETDDETDLEADLEADDETDLEADLEADDETDGETDLEADGVGVLDGTAGEFEFEKVLVPADGDGEPEVIGGVLEAPYLDDVPDGYAEEAAVIEWLDGIVETADEQTAVDALAYYESIGWLGTTVRERLSQYLSGLEHVTEPEPPVGPPADLDREDHRRSFEYVTRLATGEVEPDGI